LAKGTIIMRILVVDDDDLTRALLIVALGAEGLKNTVAATDGEEALAIFERERLDLMLVDWHMPGISGLDLLKTVRNRGSLVPFVLVTAEASREQVIEALRAGASDYIIKPFDTKTFVAKLQKYRPSAAAAPTA
jgi:two-component system, chemotaxis family, chemotaxis protein CheY